MEILCKVTSQGLVPMYDSDLEQRKRLKIDSVVRVEVKSGRNYLFHKKFMALVRLVYDNLPERIEQALGVRSFEDMLLTMKLDLGYAHTIWNGTRQVLVADSISFARMEQKDFEQFYDRAVEIALNLYLRGTTKQEVIENIESFL